MTTVKKKQRGNAQDEEKREKGKKKEVQERSIERKRILQEGKEGEKTKIEKKERCSFFPEKSREEFAKLSYLFFSFCLFPLFGDFLSLFFSPSLGKKKEEKKSEEGTLKPGGIEHQRLV